MHLVIVASLLAAAAVAELELDGVCAEPAWLSTGLWLVDATQRDVDCTTARLLVVGEPDQEGDLSLAQTVRALDARGDAPAEALASVAVLNRIDTDIVFLEGLGSVTTRIADALRLAVKSGRTLVLNSGAFSYGGSRACAAAKPRSVAPWECVWAPLARCTLADAIRAAAESARVESEAAARHDGWRGVSLQAHAAWAAAALRYVHKNVLREQGASGAARQMPAFSVPVPAPLAALGASGADWLAVVRAYLHSLLLPTTRAALRRYGGLPPHVASGGSGAELIIGIMLRTTDYGGGESLEQLAESWAVYRRLVGRIAAATGARRVLIATDEEALLPELHAMVAADLPAPTFAVRWVPRHAERPSRPHNWRSMGSQLAIHPNIRENATLDALAVVDLMGRTNVLVGRVESLLFRFAASLQRARGCGAVGGPAVWTVGNADVPAGPLEGLEGDGTWGWKSVPARQWPPPLPRAAQMAEPAVEIMALPNFD